MFGWWWRERPEEESDNEAMGEAEQKGAAGGEAAGDAGEAGGHLAGRGEVQSIASEERIQARARTAQRLGYPSISSMMKDLGYDPMLETASGEPVRPIDPHLADWLASKE